jgi:hypothetical protein
MDLKETLVNVGKWHLKTLGVKYGAQYIKRCIPLWKEKYGPELAERVAIELRSAVKEMKA